MYIYVPTYIGILTYVRIYSSFSFCSPPSLSLFLPFSLSPSLVQSLHLFVQLVVDSYRRPSTSSSLLASRFQTLGRSSLHPFSVYLSDPPQLFLSLLPLLPRSV